MAEESAQTTTTEPVQSTTPDAARLTYEELSQIEHPTEESPAPEKAAAETAPAVTGTKGEEKPPSTTEPKQEADETVKLRKRVEDQDRFIQRLGTEIGLLKKETPEDVQKRLKEVRDTYNEMALTDPFAAKAYLDQKISEENQRQQAQQQQAFIAKVQQTKADVTSHAPEFETSIEDIATLMQQDGANAQVVDQFRRMPYLFDSALVVNLTKRALQAKEITGLKSEVERLTKENQELRQKPGQLVDKIEQAASQTRPMTGKTGGASAADGSLPKPIYRMSTAELNELQKRYAATG